ncbi:glutamate--tRNA ligase family protein [Puia dinghuensis]|uniref:Glutamyl-Q tRNA(Asp) synthetase n=1 Tax=Puia dinghuensis TaxID=1792502 RepID=A0A8J2XV61_9BACT|nr:glutamate--tRNA ligase family protein [Puia dinghuensis]GGB14719.1 glutamyl-Q tRNA(Asp) synthetase [Puia dinghuensis]
MWFKKTRIAPTPSGFLHVGNILSFSLTAALARNNGASILLRIDDLDRERADPQYVEDIFETLRFLNIPWDEGPTDAAGFEKNYSQLHRITLYEKALQLLRSTNSIYACSCSRAQLLRAGNVCTCRDKGGSLDAPDVNWRLRTPPDANLPPELHDFVVRKKDGFPAYQLSSVIDDLHYGVDLIVRGEDLRDSTLAQLHLSTILAAAGFNEAAAFKKITFYHHSLLTTLTGEKLSKSAGATSIQHLHKQGLTPAAIFSLIAQLSGLAEPAEDWASLARLLFARQHAAGQ